MPNPMSTGPPAASPLASAIDGSPGDDALLAIEARTFDPTERRVVGDAVRIDIASQITTPHYPALLSASADLLTFAATEIPSGIHLATALRSGADLVIGPERDIGGFFRVSPDGGRLARTRLDPLRANNDIWIYDLVRGTRVRATTSRDRDVLPVWSPDGGRIAYRSGTNAAPTLKVSSADGVGPVQTLPCPRLNCEPTDWSPDGFLVINVSGGDVWAVPFDPSAPARPLLNESFVERDARISPNGRWLAFVSDESGRPVVSVRSVSAPPRRYIVSTSGGDQPVWRRDGRELFYVDAQRYLQRVPLRATADGGLAFGVAQPVQIPRFAERHWGTVYDLSPDGLRVYFPHPGTARDRASSAWCSAGGHCSSGDATRRLHPSEFSALRRTAFARNKSGEGWPAVVSQRARRSVFVPARPDSHTVVSIFVSPRIRLRLPECFAVGEIPRRQPQAPPVHGQVRLPLRRPVSGHRPDLPQLRKIRIQPLRRTKLKEHLAFRQASCPC